MVEVLPRRHPRREPHPVTIEVPQLSKTGSRSASTDAAPDVLTFHQVPFTP